MYIEMPKLYPMQQKVYAKAQPYRFVTCNWGRRTGKTSIIERICCFAVQGKVVYLFAPSPDTYEKTWRKVSDCIGAAAESINKTKHLMTFHNGGVLKMTSLHDIGQVDEGRGNFVDFCIYDESQSIDTEILKKHFENTMMPTLLDRNGRAFFMMTPPDSPEHYSAQLYCMGALNNPNAMGEDVPMDMHTASFSGIDTSKFISFRKTAYDNPYISNEGIELIRSVMPPIVFKQEFLAQFVQYSNKPWLICFDDAGEVERRLFQAVPIQPNLPFYLAFDFNLNPMAATLWQMDTQRSMIICHAEFGVANPNEKVSIHYTTDLIKEWFVKNLSVRIDMGTPLPAWLNIYITGDATGRAADARDAKNRNFYEIIAEQFKTEYWMRRGVFVVPDDNPDHKDSWAQMNSFLYAHKGIRINPACKRLRADMRLTKSAPNHKINKKAHDPHFLDNTRYLFNTFLAPAYGEGWR